MQSPSIHTIHVHNNNIPMFCEFLVKHNGRFESEPLITYDSQFITVQFENQSDYDDFYDEYQALTAKIIQPTKKMSLFRRLYNKIDQFFL